MKTLHRLLLNSGCVPEEGPHRFAKPIVKSAWLILLIPLAVNILAAMLLEIRQPNLGYWLMQKKWVMLEATEPVDWLILGDSSGNQGVVPEVITGRLGGTALNLCTIGDASTLHTAWMLEEYLSNRPAPKAVIIVHAYDVWSRDPDPGTLAQVPIKFAYRHRELLLEYFSQEPKSLASYFAAKLFPGAYYDQSIRHMIFRPFEQIQRDQLVSTTGYMAVEKRGNFPLAADLAKHEKGLADAEKVLSRAGTIALKRLSDQHQVPIFLVYAPVYDALAMQSAWQGYTQELSGSITSISEASPATHLITEPYVGAEAVMENVDHMLHPYSTEYTRWICSQIESKLH